jgi:hypothetical protein
VEGLLGPYGFKRVVCSGALGFFAQSLRGDLRYHGLPPRGPTGKATVERIEVKRWKGGLKFLREALAQDDSQAVVVDPGGPLADMVVALPISVFQKLLGEAGYCPEDEAGEVPYA